jgi:hypothetical protein
MLEDDKIESEARLLIYELLLVMYQHGLRQVHVGGLMRMLGVANENALAHDDEVVVLDDNFAKYVLEVTEPRHSDQTLH